MEQGQLRPFSLDEERPAGVDRQREEGEEHAEQLDIGHPPG